MAKPGVIFALAILSFAPLGFAQEEAQPDELSEFNELMNRMAVEFMLKWKELEPELREMNKNLSEDFGAWAETWEESMREWADEWARQREALGETPDPGDPDRKRWIDQQAQRARGAYQQALDRLRSGEQNVELTIYFVGAAATVPLPDVLQPALDQMRQQSGEQQLGLIATAALRLGEGNSGSLRGELPEDSPITGYEVQIGNVEVLDGDIRIDQVAASVRFETHQPALARRSSTQSTIQTGLTVPAGTPIIAGTLMARQPILAVVLANVVE